jgi:hypothetical protein
MAMASSAWPAASIVSKTSAVSCPFVPIRPQWRTSRIVRDKARSFINA